MFTLDGIRKLHGWTHLPPSHFLVDSQQAVFTSSDDRIGAGMRSSVTMVLSSCSRT